MASFDRIRQSCFRSGLAGLAIGLALFASACGSNVDAKRFVQLADDVVRGIKVRVIPSQASTVVIAEQRKRFVRRITVALPELYHRRVESAADGAVCSGLRTVVEEGRFPTVGEWRAAILEGLTGGLPVPEPEELSQALAQELMLIVASALDPDRDGLVEIEDARDAYARYQVAAGTILERTCEEILEDVTS